MNGKVKSLSWKKCFSYSLEKILEAVTAAAEENNVDRFSPIVEGLQDNSVQLQVSKFFSQTSATTVIKINYFSLLNKSLQ